MKRRHLKPDRRVVVELYETNNDVGGDRAIGSRVKRSWPARLTSARNVLVEIRDGCPYSLDEVELDAVNEVVSLLGWFIDEGHDAEPR